MAELSIGAAVGSGFELIRHRPLEVLAWGLIEVAFVVAAFALMAPAYAGLYSQVLTAARSGVEATPDFGRVLQAQGAGMLFRLASYFVGAVVYCAAYRAVLRPEDRRLAYLRLGTAELFFFLLMVGGALVFVIALVILVLVGALIVGLLVASHAAIVGVLVGIVGGAALLVGIVYVALRFSLVGPMIVEDGRFHLLESWALTRGRVGHLFLIFLCLVAIAIVAEVILGGVLLTLGASLLGNAAGGLENLPVFFQRPPTAILSSLTPLLFVLGLIGIPLSGAVVAVFCAPWARAYRELAEPIPAAAVL